MSKADRIALATAVLLASWGETCAAQVLRSPVTVNVVDTSGKPISNALVQLTPSATQKLIADKLTGASFSGLTDEDGKFTTQVIVHDGLYSVSASRAGFSAVAGAVKAPLPPVIALQLEAEAQTLGAAEPNTSPAIPQSAPALEAQATAVSGAAQDGQPPPDARLLPTLWAGVRDFGLVIVLALAPLISFFVLRAISVRLVLSYMMRKAPKGSLLPLPEEAGRARSAPGAAGELGFLNLNNTNGVLLNGSAQDRLERTEDTGRRTLRTLLLSVLAGFGAWTAVVAVEAIAVPEMRLVAVPELGAGAGLFLVMLVVAGYVYWLARRLTLWMSVVVCLVTLGAGIALWKLAQVPPYFAMVPGMSQGLTAWFLIRRDHQKMVAAGNKHLLILRVFGSDKSTAFTFGTLMSKWRFVGSFLTIVDPSYIRYQFAAFSPLQWRRTAAGTIWYGLAAAILGFAAVMAAATYPELLPAMWATMPVKEQTQMLMNAGYLILIPLAILPIFLYVTSRFAKSQSEAARRIVKSIEEGKEPRRGIFRGIPIWCFDDVWKPSVRHMLSHASAILMDLRGFTPERKGCAHEIGELIDRFPIERVLFLVDENADKEALYSLIRERWSAMSADSPNLAVRNALLKVYETNPKAKARQVRKDVVRILGLLSACVDEKSARDAPPKALVQFA